MAPWFRVSRRARTRLLAGCQEQLWGRVLHRGIDCLLGCMTSTSAASIPTSCPLLRTLESACYLLATALRSRVNGIRRKAATHGYISSRGLFVNGSDHQLTPTPITAALCSIPGGIRHLL